MTRPLRVTVCELHDDRAAFARDWTRLAAHVQDHKSELVLLPEMDGRHDVPEITTRCWGILHKRPEDVMCATSRMVVKRKGADRPSVVPCTLLPYDPRFDMGAKVVVPGIPPPPPSTTCEVLAGRSRAAVDARSTGDRARSSGLRAEHASVVPAATSNSPRRANAVDCSVSARSPLPSICPSRSPSCWRWFRA